MGSFPRDKMKNKEYNTIEKVAKSILSNTQIHNRSLIWLGTDTSIKKGGPGWLNELGSGITQHGVGSRSALQITKRVHSTRSRK